MSSSFHSTGDAPTQRVPAWKRLGLKLKPASEAQNHDATLPAGPSVPNNQAHLGGSTPNAKRKVSAGTAPALDHSTKRARQDNWQNQNTTSSHQTPKKAKSVSFTPDTTGSRPPAAAKQPKKQKTTSSTNDAAASPAPAKPIRRTAPVNLEPALAYLRTWHTARESWKFNKNHQTKLLEQVFAGADETTIPAVDIGIFYEYIQGLQGGVRTRLRALANGIKAQDMEQGATAFAGSNKAEMAERKQNEYEKVIRAFLGQPKTAEKRRFDEVDYVLRTADMEMQRRVVKRMRAEMVLEELSETDASETTATTNSIKSTSTEKGDATTNARDQNNADEEKRVSLNDGPPHRVKRRRKTRTAAVEDTSSESSSESESESESESDSDTSSSGSSGDGSSDSSDDEDEGSGARTRRDEETSSSSSSSSSSESESSDDSDDD